jgi:hypothetical protein
VARWLVARRIKWGILSLPLAGLVYLQGLVVAGDYVYPTDDNLRRYAEYVTSARFHSSILLDALHATLLLIGIIALYAYLANSHVERWALAGLVLGCASAASRTHQDVGFDISAIPAAERYLGGQQDALEGVLLASDPGNFPLLIVVSGGVLDGLFPILSNLFFGVAIWRSGTLPQGAAILWVGASVLGVVSLTPPLSLFGWIEALIVALDLGGSGWIAWSVWQQPLVR